MPHCVAMVPRSSKPLAADHIGRAPKKCLAAYDFASSHITPYLSSEAQLSTCFREEIVDVIADGETAFRAPGRHQEVPRVVLRCSERCPLWCHPIRRGALQLASICTEKGGRTAKKRSPERANPFRVVRRYVKRRTKLESGGHGARTRNPITGAPHFQSE